MADTPRQTSQLTSFADDQPLTFGTGQLYSIEYAGAFRVTGVAATPTSNGTDASYSSAVGGSTSGNSGNSAFTTGDTTDGATGSVSIATGDALGTAKDSGDIDIDTGNATGNSGDVNIAAFGRANVGFYGATAVVQQTTVANAAGTDAAIIDAIRDALVAYGLLA